MAAFNKSNWSRTESSNKAIQYRPSAFGGIPATSIPANSTAVITATVRRDFKGNGPIDITLVLNTGASGSLQSGLSLGETQLLSPASGSYAAGNLPRIQYKVINSTIAAITPPATDVLATQF